MPKKTLLAVISLSFLLLPVIFGDVGIFAATQYPQLTERESQVISMVSGTNAYDKDLELERIALDHNGSGYAFRSAGSPGANQTANWIKSQFESLGLETHLESFEFTNWSMPSQPTLVIDQDNNADTVDDQVVMKSFQAAHYSLPTPEGGVFSDLVALPLPENLWYWQIREGDVPTYNASAWARIDTTGKILLIGREVNWYYGYRRVFQQKLSTQRPAVLIYTWWYDWMSFTPQLYGSMGGRTLWESGIPVAYLDYNDGLWIREHEASVNVFASVEIPAAIGYGTHYNVVGKLKGSVNPEKAVIISGHYDTVMDAGFCDNGAGTAGVIELARVFTDAARTGVYTPEQTLLFVAFTGEELGFVGAINYIRQHKDEMKHISAVVNLDCIGHNVLTVSETFSDDNGLELDDIVLKAAGDLGVDAQLEDLGGSDQEAFRNPIESASFYEEYWGTDPNINDTARVKSSTMLGSYPLFYSDYFENGVAGWIHTDYDNSTSTVTLNWVTAGVLEAHIKVAALSVMRVLAALYNPFFSQVFIGSGIAAVVVAVLVFLERSKVKTALIKAYNNIASYVEMREIIYAIALTAFLLFSSYAAYTRIGRIEIMAKGVPTVLSMRYFGYPFEMLGIPLQLSVTEPDIELVITQLTLNPESSTPEILWPGLLLNAVLFFVISLSIVYLAARVWYAYLSRKSPGTV